MYKERLILPSSCSKIWMLSVLRFDMKYSVAMRAPQSPPAPPLKPFFTASAII